MEKFARIPVSYTHLDVYKRQEQGEPNSKEMPSVAFWDYMNRHPEKEAGSLRIVTDYIAGMTDPYANRMFNTIYGM